MVGDGSKNIKTPSRSYTLGTCLKIIYQSFIYMKAVVQWGAGFSLEATVGTSLQVFVLLCFVFQFFSPTNSMCLFLDLSLGQ